MPHDLQVPFFISALENLAFLELFECCSLDRIFKTCSATCSIIWSLQLHWHKVHQIKQFHAIFITSRSVNSYERWIIDNLMEMMSLYQLAITTGVANILVWYYGTLITIWFLANHQLSTDLICLYQKPFAFGLANSWWNSDIILVSWLPIMVFHSLYHKP